MANHPRPNKPVSPLVVSLDFRGNAHDQRSQTLEFAKRIAPTGVVAKVNSALVASGVELIDELHGLGLYVFCDLKLDDIPSTMERYAEALYAYDPEYVTVKCSAGVESMATVKQYLDRTEVVAVSVLSSFSDRDRYSVHGLQSDQLPYALVGVAISARVHSIVMPIQDLNSSVADRTKHLGMNHIVAGVRFADNTAYDQVHVTTPENAIHSGAGQLIVGRPITEATDPVKEIERFLDAIHSAEQSLV